MIVGEAALTAAQRLTLYARGYRARLMECMAAEFPCLRALAGQQVVRPVPRRATSPSGPRPTPASTAWARASPTIWRPRGRPATSGPGALSAIPADLARLDRARAEVQRAAGVERLAGRAPSAGPAADASAPPAAAR